MTPESAGGWGFRSSHPAFEEGETLVVYAGPYDESHGGLTVRIGDTKLLVPDGTPAMEDRVVQVTVTRFDAERHEGEARLDEVRGRSGL